MGANIDLDDKTLTKLVVSLFEQGCPPLLDPFRKELESRGYVLEEKLTLEVRKA